jgi:hypothetical protein
MHGLRIRLIGAGCIAAIVAIALMFVWVTAETTDVPADDAITHRVLTQGYIEDSGSGDPLAEATLSFHRPRTSSQKLVSLTSNADGWFDAIRLAEYTRDAYPDQLQCCFLPMRSSRWTVQYANSGQITDDLPYGLKGFPPAKAEIIRDWTTGTLSIQTPTCGEVVINVRDPNGAPLDNGAVHLFPAGPPFYDDNTLRLTGETDASGDIRVRWWVGLYRLIVVAPGTGFASTAYFEVLPGKVEHVPLPLLARFGRIEGRVAGVHVDDLKPLVMGNAAWCRTTARVRRDGSFTLLDVIPGRHSLTYFAEKTSHTVSVDVPPGETLQGIEIPHPDDQAKRNAEAIASQNSMSPIVLRTASIVGVVRDVAGTALPGVKVLILNEPSNISSGYTFAHTAVTAHDGSYLVEDLRVGQFGTDRCTVIVAMPGRAASVASVLHGVPERIEKKLMQPDIMNRSGQFRSPKVDTREGIHEVRHYRADVTVAGPGCTLAVQVTQRGQPARHAPVWLVGENTPLSRLSTRGMDRTPEAVQDVLGLGSPVQLTDSNGLVRFEHLLPGRYRVEAQASVSDEQLERFVKYRHRFMRRPGGDDAEWSVHHGIGVAAGEVRRLSVQLNPTPTPLPIRVHDPDGGRLMTTGSVACSFLLTSAPATGTNTAAESLQLAPRHPGLWYLTVRSRRSGAPFRTHKYGFFFEAHAGVAVSRLLGERPVHLTAQFRESDQQTLTVRLLDRHGMPVPGTVIVRSGNSGPLVNAASTLDGVAVFAGVPSGRYRVRGFLSGRKSPPIPGPDVRDESLEDHVKMVPEDIQTDRSGPQEVELQERPVGYVRCEIQFPDGADASEYFYQAVGSDEDRYHRKHFDTESSSLLCGPFLESAVKLVVHRRFPNGGKGKVAEKDVSVEQGRLVTCKLEIPPENRQPIPDHPTILPGSIRYAYFKEQPPGEALTGQVLHADGSPAWAAQVMEYIPRQRTSTRVDSTDIHGHFRMGDRRVDRRVFWWPQEANQSPPADPDGSPVHPVLVAHIPGSCGGAFIPVSDGLANGFQIKLPPVWTLRGRITVDGQSPELFGDSVRVLARYRGHGKLADIFSIDRTASADGTFLLAGLTPGAYDIQATLDGIWLSESVRLDVPATAPKREVLADIVLPIATPGAAAHVQITDADGLPLADQSIHVRFPPGPLAEDMHREPLKTDQLGIVRIDGCTAGRHTLTVEGFRDVLEFEVPRYDHPDDTPQVVSPADPCRQ